VFQHDSAPDNCHNQFRNGIERHGLCGYGVDNASASTHQTKFHDPGNVPHIDMVASLFAAAEQSNFTIF
jgi:hypothetical protein